MFETLAASLPPVQVVDIKGKYIPMDFSVSNTELTEIKTPDEYEAYINKYLAENSADIAFGGYNEVRNLYKRSDLFNDTETEERNIHIGIDLWAAAGTNVLAALDGTIHSFDYNTGLGNYGPTIILEHIINGLTFFTLYGHLSMESIEEIEIGDQFKRGAVIATLGDASVNGDYAPHLHFQIILDIENYFGDYPGVCSKDDLKFYLQNCPDPNLLLKLK